MICKSQSVPMAMRWRFGWKTILVWVSQVSGHQRYSAATSAWGAATLLETGGSSANFPQVADGR